MDKQLTQRGQRELAEERGEATEPIEPLRREHTDMGVTVNQVRHTSPDDKTPPQELAARQARAFESTFAAQANELEQVNENLNKDENLSQGSGPPLVKMDDPNAPHNQVQSAGNVRYSNIHERRLAGVDAGMPGTRTGQALQVVAESLIGSKVWDVQNDGSVVLKVQTKDHTRAYRYDGVEPQGLSEIEKLKISFWFPAISPNVAQRQFVIQVANNRPAQMFFTPDQANVEVLVNVDVPIHVELTHINQMGVRSRPWVVDFYSNPRSTPRPLGASALTFHMMERVLVTGEPFQWDGNADTTTTESHEEEPKLEGNPPASDSPSAPAINAVDQNPNPDDIHREQNLQNASQE